MSISDLRSGLHSIRVDQTPFLVLKSNAVLRGCRSCGTDLAAHPELIAP
jgi:hypothetical protein